MKIFFILLFLVLNQSYAQFTMSLVGDGTNIENEQTFEFGTTDSSSSEVKFHINNTSTQTIKMWSEVVSIEGSDGSNFQFCFSGECYFDVFVGLNVPSEPISITAGEHQGNNFDHFWNKSENSPITYRIKFFQVNDANQEIGTPLYINYVYDEDALSINEVDDSLNKIISIQNNIVQDVLEVNTIYPSTGYLYNITGEQLQTFALKSGSNSIKLTHFSSGIYFVKIQSEAGHTLAQKIVIQ